MVLEYHSHMAPRPLFGAPLPSCNDLLNGVQPREESASVRCGNCRIIGREPLNFAESDHELCRPCQSRARLYYDPSNFLPPERETYAIDQSSNRRQSAQLTSTSSSLPAPSTTPGHHAITPSYHVPTLLNQPSPTWSTAHPSPPPYPRLNLPLSSHPTNNLLPIPRAPLVSKAAIKAATNARHKDSEKKRRDVAVSCVQTVEIFARDLHPGIAAGCQVCCIEDDAERKRIAAANPANLSGDDGRGDDLVSRMKRPKNDKLEESCMFMYRYVLHHEREMYPQRLEELAQLAAEQRREQDRGIRDAGMNQTKLRKWKGDQRAFQTEKLLRQARELGRTHGIIVDSGQEVNKCSKRKRDDDTNEGCKRQCVAPTPPSSVGSLMSRPSTPDSGDEKSVA